LISGPDSFGRLPSGVITRVLFRLFLVILMMLAAVGLAAAEPLVLSVARASVMPDKVVAGQKLLSLELAPASREAFAEFSREHVGDTVDLRVDGDLVASPRLVEPILGGVLVVSGMFKSGELEAIAKRIFAGDARVEVEARAE